MNDLRISLVQGNTRWRDPEGNREYYAGLIGSLAGMTDLVVLPETFTSGFSSDVAEKVETMDGPTVAWILDRASAIGAVVTGSVQLRVGEDVFNRLLWARPDGEMYVYDKRHLFRYAGEHKRYSAGRARLTVEWKGWRINPQVCYDLRFPVFCRNRYDVERAGALDFDLQLFVANWPSVRAHAWETLLHARAMENLCYVVGVNRVGADGNNLHYSGGSRVIDPLGRTQIHVGNCEQVVTTAISSDRLVRHREHFPAMLDADRFHWE